MPIKKTKAPAKKTVKIKAPKPIGVVTHFYDKISVGIVKAKAPFKVGDVLKFVGKHGEFEQPVASMQLMHEAVAKVAKGKEVGIKVKKPVYEKDLVYLA